jgi:hypothetical protein
VTVATRPLFVPGRVGALVEEVNVSFEWHPGFAPVQKRRNVGALHAAATDKGLGRVLEV